MANELKLTLLKIIQLLWIVPIMALLKDVSILSSCVNLLKSKHSIIFACSTENLWSASAELLRFNQLVYPVNLESRFSLTSILSRKVYARTTVVVDCACNTSTELIRAASVNRYFNKTYQWLLLDNNNIGFENILPPDVENLGPNAQMIYMNGSENSSLYLWDVHSKGRHLQSPIIIKIFGEKMYSPNNNSFIIHNDLITLQGVNFRKQFNGLTLRAATVIDQDNITTNADIENILSQPNKNAGVAAFTKYHYVLLQILAGYFNFTVNFRNARGWASRLGNTKFRLGFLGIMLRNEADIGASGAFNRINRFAEFDTIHQSWKFETAFLYRFTPDLNIHGKRGNFLAPFDVEVWLFSFGTLLIINMAWTIEKWLKYKTILSPKYGVSKIDHDQQNNSDNKRNTLEHGGTMSKTTDIGIKNDKTGLSLNIFAAVCQQGMEPIPNGLVSRMIIITIFLFSLVMYNYYTSSVVGGLLSSTAQGPSSVNDIIYSSLNLAFEDIGYYKVLFRENKSPVIGQLLSRKLQPARSPNDVPVYTHIEDAIPYIKNGSIAFHCEVVDAFPVIARYFDAGEICDLRVVSGLMETELMNWIIHKNSQYTEVFRIAISRAREVGLIEHLLRQRQPKKPPCQSLYTVYPVNFSSVISAFVVLSVGLLMSLLVLIIEHVINRYL